MGNLIQQTRRFFAVLYLFFSFECERTMFLLLFKSCERKPPQL